MNVRDFQAGSLGYRNDARRTVPNAPAELFPCACCGLACVAFPTAHGLAGSQSDSHKEGMYDIDIVLMTM